MRPTTSAEATRLAAPARVTHVRATLERADGAWIDVTDWLLGVTLTEDRDAGAISGTFRFRREARRDANAFTTGVAATSEANLVVSLAPLVTLSPANTFSGSHSSGTGFLYDPLVVPFRGVRLDVAVTAPGETPGTGSAPAWTRVFDGVIDDPSWGGTASVLEVAVRDLAARLQDTLIEEERDYGSAGGTPIEGVLQQILADNGFPVTVAVLGDTEGWSLKPYTQARGVSVWDAVRQLALQMGWDFRYWRHADGTYRPTLLEPRRADDPATAPDVTFTSDEVIDIPRLSLNGSDVRNAGELLYIDRATEEEATVTASAPDSIAEFGRRAFGIDERQQYPRTAAEAQQMLDAAVADLATPYVEQDAVVRFWWPLQLGDAVRFDLGAGSILPGTTFDTNRYYDTAIAFAVTALRHELTLANGGLTATTTLSLRGRSVGAFRRWLVLIGEAPTAASAAIVQQQLVQALVPSPLTLLAPGAPVTWSAMPSADTEVFGGTWLRQRASLNGDRKSVV